MSVSTTTAPFPGATRAPFAPQDPFWLGEALVADGSITRDQFKKACESHRPGTPFADTLQALSIASATKIAELIAAKHGLPTVDFAHETFDPTVVRKLPQIRATKVCALPFKLRDGVLSIAIADPSQYPAVQAAADLKHERIEFYVAPRRNVLALIADAWRNDLPATNTREFLESILNLSIRRGASDIHLVPRESSLVVRFRVDGEIIDETYVGSEFRVLLVNQAITNARLDTMESRKPQHGQIKQEFAGRVYTFRLATLPTFHGLAAYLRVLDESAHSRPLAALGLHPDQAKLAISVLDKPDGVIIATGPTGSGKTTLLHSLLSRLPRSLNIITVEDPIEYVNPNYTQVTVKTERGQSFDGYLADLLRCDPDVMLFGEIRTRETAEATIRASLTGHLVFTTLHTNDGVAAIARLVDLKIEPFLIGSGIRAIMAQRLIRKLCPKCSVPDVRLETLRQSFGKPTADFRQAHPDGCSHCNYRGTLRRTGIFEVLPIIFDHSAEITAQTQHYSTLIQDIERQLTNHKLTPAAAEQLTGELARLTGELAKAISDERKKEQEVVDLIIQKAPEELIRSIYRRRGILSLRDHGIEKAAAGEVSLDEVFSHV
jgi:type IV pilus assembly protein PilB